jgi:hypothetical protein
VQAFSFTEFASLFRHQEFAVQNGMPLMNVVPSSSPMLRLLKKLLGKLLLMVIPAPLKADMRCWISWQGLREGIINDESVGYKHGTGTEESGRSMVMVDESVRRGTDICLWL